MSPNKIGRYKILSEIGRGGMATVYRAQDPSFDRDVAIKVLPTELLHDPTFRERFDREARTIARLEHAAIVPVYDYGEDGGHAFLVMRHMTGSSLSNRLKEGPVSLPQTLEIMDRIAAALEEAHLRGIIHRDLKPGNILFDRYGDAFLSDFGIAKLAEAGASLTGTGIVGTPAYMSPEQARAEKEIDGRSDVYSLGVILFEMLTGQAPYDADTPMGIAIKHILDPIPNILDLRPDLPPGIAPIINNALAKDVDLRYQTPSEIVADLRRVIEGGFVPETRASPVLASIPLGTLARDETLASPATESTQPARVAAPPPPGGSPPARTTQPPLPTGVPAPTFGRDRSHRLREFLGNRRIQAAILLTLLVMVLWRGCSIPGALFNMAKPDIPDAGQTVSGDLVQRLDGAESLDVTVKLTASNAEFSAIQDDRYALRGEYTLGENLVPTLSYQRDGTRGILNVEQAEWSFPFGDGQSTGDITLGLTAAVPLDLTVQTGFNETNLDLSGLTLNSLRITGGVGKVTVTLPEHGTGLRVYVTGGVGELIVNAPTDSSAMDLQSLEVSGGVGAIRLTLPNQGDFAVNVNSALGEVTIRVPQGLFASLRFDSGLADLKMSNDRFERIDDQRWQIPGFDTATNRAEIHITAGVGSVTITD